MTTRIVDALSELRRQPAGFHKVPDGPGVLHLRSRTLESSNDVGYEKVWARYHEAVAEARRVWGEPAYEGPGRRADRSPDGVRRGVYGESDDQWRAGYQGDCPSSDEYFEQLYNQALRIAWWKGESFVHAVMVTGHDANTLQILRLAVAEAKDEA
jgi:hypothetical protein